LGDPFTLFDECCGIQVGGWGSIGYHTAALPAFNNRPNEVQLQQAWLYAEKAIDTSCGFDIGGRMDFLYGTDGPNTQAFGIANNHWDNGWDNGPDNSGYGSAMPQLYAEMGYGDLSVKLGHFYTIIGYEVVAATGNFFYSHAYTFNFSEPFTHTGALATYNASDDLTLYGGYVLGWDSGFEDNGDAFLGGFSLGLSDDLTLTYASTFGTFNDDFNGDATGVRNQGYMQSIVADMSLSDSVQYIFQSDYLTADLNDNTGGADTFGINQYLIKTVNDCLSYGARVEWWNVDTRGAALDLDAYAITTGINYRPHANVVVRPELRYDWIDGDVAAIAAAGGASLENARDSQFTFGMDTVFTF